MNKIKSFTYLILYVFIISIFISCSPNPKKYGDTTINIFDHDIINFKDTVLKDDIKRLGNGRLLIKRITLPAYERRVTIQGKLTLVSNGDPWDKSGSVFLLPEESYINLLTISDSTLSYPENYLDHVGILKQDDFKPVIELMRFMTPFGIGHFSDTSRITPPVYLDNWEKEVIWETDLSKFYNRLSGDVYIGIWIDTWTEEGYKISFELDYNETELECDMQPSYRIDPLVNTVYYHHPMKIPGFFSDTSIHVSFTLPVNYSDAILLYTVTGHGGHSGGDEFVKKENRIYIDGKILDKFIPWRDDCHTFRSYNPSSGVWKVKHPFRGEEMDQLLASSDLSRSNWCPGSLVEPIIIKLPALQEGTHELVIEIPDAQEMTDNELNHWLISCNLVYTLNE